MNACCKGLTPQQHDSIRSSQKPPPPSVEFIGRLSSPIWLEAHPQMPPHQPVRFVCRQDRVHPVQQQLHDSRPSEPFNAYGQPSLETVRVIGTKR